MMRIALGGAGVAVAPNDTLMLPLCRLIDAASVCAPGVTPSDHRVLASPFASVFTVLGAAEPLPAPGANVTVSPMTGSEFAPVTRTTTGDARVAPAEACCPSPLTFAMAVAPVAVALNVTVGEPCGPTSDAVSVCGPSVGASVQVTTA